MRTLQALNGMEIPVLGQGTWGMGERSSHAPNEIAALRHGLDLGIRLIDTAEMYGEGGAEQVVGSALADRRDEAFLVSKVYPHNATRQGTIRACERSLQRLGTDHLDLYLLHWRGRTPLAETVDAFEQLRADGKIRYFGVSNFDPDDMAELWQHDSGRQASTNQVLYNLTRRGVEVDLLPWCREAALPVMAYSPIEQGRLLNSAVLAQVAQRHAATPAQVALAWTVNGAGVCCIPKAVTPEHVTQNLAALEIELSTADLAELDEAFPAPTQPVPLEIL